MRCLVTTVCLLLFAPSIFAGEPLPSVPLTFFFVAAPASEPTSFDLIDFRTEQRLQPRSRVDVHPHTISGINQPVGIGMGTDNGSGHGTLGFKLPLPEWG